MKLYIENNYESMSAKAVDDILKIIQPLKNPLLCTASGDSPKGLYKELIKQVNERKIDITGWNFVSLDEWLGMNSGDEGSCRFHLNNDLFGPMHVEENRIVFFNGRATDVKEECRRIESFINQKGGIDVAILGLGMNGHVGMNEPGTPTASQSHVAEIDILTQQVGQKYFKKQQQLSQGLTLGIANLMEARHVAMVVSGVKKAEIVRQVIEKEISDNLPASLLRRHKNLSMYLDADAASLLQKK